MAADMLRQLFSRGRFFALGLCLLSLPLFFPPAVSQAEEIAYDWGAERIFVGENAYDTFTVDLSKSRLDFLLTDRHGRRIGSLAGAKAFLAEQKRDLLFATNGGMFTPDWEPNGLFIADGLTVYPMDLGSADGNFYLKPNGVFFLTETGAGIVASPDFKNVMENDYVTYATQSGPMLVKDGEIHKAFRPESESKHIRSGVGILPGNRVVFAISNQEVNFYDFASLFKDRLGCKNALFLDGTISKMYLPALNRHELDGDFAVMIAVSQ